MSTRELDVIVIGCGSAGSRAAAAATAAGARVVAFEGGEQLGGLCILRGCMPTKTLLETAHRAHVIRDGERFGIRVGAPEIDFSAQMERTRSLVARFRRAKEASIHGGDYELIRGRPRFVSPHEVELDGERFRAASFVVATGSDTRDLGVPVPDGARVLTSDDMFQLTAAPERALVIGGGAVGLEFATWLARMGSQVTLSVRSPLLHRTDPEMGEEIHRALADEMDVFVPSRLTALDASDGKTVAQLAGADGDERSVEVDFVLNATGRVPSLTGLDLAAAGLAGDVTVNDRLQSEQAHVFFAGDASERTMILHEANLEGRLAGANAARVAGVADGELESMDGLTPPMSVIFTDPAFATVGLSPREAEARGIPVASAVKRFPEQGRGIVMGDRHGFVRLLAEPGGGRVLGCQVLSSRADDLIHVPSAVICLGGTVEQMQRMPWYHPTLAEAFIEVVRDLLD